MTDVCLSLLGAPEIEEKLLDQLLLSPHAATFTSQPAAGHGGHPATLDAREQVLGRSDAVLIQVLLELSEAEHLIDDLRPLLADSGVRYWVVPVLNQGVF